MSSNHRIGKMREHLASNRGPKAPTHATDLAQAVIQIAKVNSKIAAISKQLQSLHGPKNDPRALTSSITRARDQSDDPVQAEAISALLDAFDFDDLQAIAGNRKRIQDMHCKDHLRERTRKMRQLLQMGRLVRKVLQERYPLSWERLLQS